jgi:tRNA-dihydrouridine synthase B
MDLASYFKTVQIGSVKLANNVALAPMAGTTDVVYRRICRELGAGLTVTELVSARGIVYDPDLKRNFRYLEIDPAENPVAIQLFGNDPEDFSRAVKRIMDHPVLSGCAMIDINMGCPVAKVVKQGAGSALMQNPQLAGRIVYAVSEALAGSGKPVTVKIRSGWSDLELNAVEVARICQNNGAQAITVHARTRSQMYSGRADWKHIYNVRQALSIPVFGNGDISSPDSAVKMILQTGADGVMIGRAAQGNPWLFARFCPDIAEAFNLVFGSDGLPSKEVRFPWIIRHIDGMIERLGEAAAIRELRTQMAFYLRSSHNAAHFRARSMSAATRGELMTVLEEWRID